MKPVGVGILGCGNIAGPYVSDLKKRDHISLVAACDPLFERAQALAESFGGQAHSSLEDLLASPEVEIVANLSIHHAHYETTKRCLEAGKHVHSEKPIALTPAEAWDLVETADRHGVRLGSSPFTWMGPASQALARCVRDGKLGTPRLVLAEVNWDLIEKWHPNPAPFHRVGSLWDVGVYPLTLATSIFGPVSRVTAQGRLLKKDRVSKEGEPFELETPDWILTTLDFASGVVMRLTTSFYSGPSKQRASIEVHGDEATAVLGDWLNFDEPLLISPRGGEFAEEPFAKGGIYLDWGLAIDDLAEAIREGSPHRATGRQAAHIVDVLQAANQSMAEGRSSEVRTTFDLPAAMPTA